MPVSTSQLFLGDISALTSIHSVNPVVVPPPLLALHPALPLLLRQHNPAELTQRLHPPVTPLLMPLHPPQVLLLPLLHPVNLA